MNHFNCDYLISDLHISTPGKCKRIIKTKHFLSYSRVLSSINSPPPLFDIFSYYSCSGNERDFSFNTREQYHWCWIVVSGSNPTLLRYIRSVIEFSLGQPVYLSINTLVHGSIHLHTLLTGSVNTLLSRSVYTLTLDQSKPLSHG